MGTGYTRNDTTNNIADGNVINAADLDGEFDAIVTALSTGGHTHDGTAAEGGPVTVVGPAQDVVVSANTVTPKTDNTLDLGTSSLEFKDLFLDGTAHIDTLDVDENANIDGNLAIGGTLTVTGTTTFNGGTITLGDAATDNVVFAADVDSSIIPDDDDTYDLGSASQQWRNLFIDGTANIDTASIDNISDDTLVATNKKIQFRDTAISVSSSADATLDIASDGAINLTAGTDVVIPANVGITFGTGEKIEGDSTDLTITSGADINLTATADVNIPSGVGVTFGNDGEKIEGDGTNLAINSSGDVNITATTVDLNGNLEVSGTLTQTGIATFTDDIIIGDGKTIGSTSDVDAITIASNGQVTLTQTLIGTALDISGDIDIDGTTNLDVVDIDGAVDMASTLAVTGIATFTDDIIIGDGKTIGSASDVDAIAIGADGDVTLTQDLELQHDGAILSFGANDEITVTHVADRGLTITNTNTGDNKPVVLQLKSEEDIMQANELIASVEFAAGDSDGTDGATIAAGIHAIAEDDFSASSNLTKLVFTTGVSETAAFGATAKMTLSSAGDLTTAGDATVGGTLDTTGAVNLNLATDSTNSTSGALIVDGGVGIAKKLFVGTDLDVDGTANLDIVDIDGAVDMALTLAVAGVVTANAGVVVDEMTLDADTLTATDDFILDVAGNIEINADGGTVTFKDDGATLGTVTSAGFSGTSATVTVSDNNANTNFPVVFHDESNALLDDTGALRYNPSTGQLLVPNLTVAGTTTTVDTVTMEAANAIIFEGATADAHETTLTIVDPTADRTVNIPNQSGTIPLLAAASNTAVTSTPEELNILDGATVVVGEINALDLGSTGTGTAIASKAVILDGSKDYTGINDLTITGELVAATLDISGAIDVAGTTNLDVVDVDGAVNMATTALVTGVLTTTAATVFNGGFASNGNSTVDGTFSTAGGLVHLGDANTSLDFGTDTQTFFAGGVRSLDLTTAEAVFNQLGADVDFRVETDGDTHALFIEGDTNRVSIGSNDPPMKLTVRNGSANSDIAKFTGDGTGAGLTISTAATTRADDTVVLKASDAFGEFSFVSDSTEVLRLDKDNNVVISNSGGTLSTATAGTSNLRLGVNTGNSIVSGANENVLIGDEAGTALVSGGINNTAVGFSALKTEDAHGSNTAIGWSALKNLNAGAEGKNTAVGADSGRGMNTGVSNTLVGFEAGHDVSSGGSNTFVGANAGDKTDDGASNVAVGHNSLGANCADQNTAVGASALAACTGRDNTAVGFSAGTTNIGGLENTAVGVFALRFNATGNNSTAVGNQALHRSLANNNTAVGGLAAEQVTTGTQNTFIGAKAGENATTPDSSVFIGFNAGGDAIVTGNQNVLIGQDAGKNITSANTSVMIGFNNGDAMVGGGANTSVGSGNSFSSTSVDTEFIYGRNATGSGAATMTIGNGDTDAVLAIDGSDTSWAAASDLRLKKNIVTSTAGLSFIKELRPIQYEWKNRGEVDSSITRYHEADSTEPCRGVGGTFHGFVAQEVKTAIDNHSSQFSDKHNIWRERVDGIQSVSPGNLVPMLVKAIQEQNDLIVALTARVATLEG